MTSEFAIAVHALVYLHHKNAVLSSEELAENICTNSARVRKVMAKLKKKELIGTKEGIKGGYHMSLDASEITLGDICEALQVDIVKAAWRSGSMDMDCMIASGMAAVSYTHLHFYEWDQSRNKVTFCREDSPVLYMACLLYTSRCV